MNFESIDIKHVRRELNKEADRKANEAIELQLNPNLIPDLLQDIEAPWDCMDGLVEVFREAQPHTFH